MPAPRRGLDPNSDVLALLALGALALVSLSLAGRPRAADAPLPNTRLRPAPSGGASRCIAGPDAADIARMAEAGRGREAEAPHEIPPAGWKDVLWRTWNEFLGDHVLTQAAAVTFYVTLAVFPAIAAMVSIYGLFADRATVAAHVASLDWILPGGALDVLGAQVTRVAEKGNSTLSLAFALSLVLSLWSANAGIKAMFEALNVVYEEDEKRSLVMLNLESLVFTLAGIVFAAVSIATVVALPIVLDRLWLGPWTETLIRLGRWPILFAVVATLLAFLYRFGPSRRRAKWRWVSWGSALASVLWVVLSMGFSYYAAHFGRFDETYGSLGAAIAFMTWVWLSVTVVLIGAELNSELEHQTARDSTEGRPRPLGRRGAEMADTIGQGV